MFSVSFNQKLLLFDALESKFTTIKLRGKQKRCVVCGDEPTIKKLQDYEQFCGTAASDKVQKNYFTFSQNVNYLALNM